MTLFFDGETAGQGEDRVREVTKPPKPFVPWPDFDPAAVKCGNIGGPDSEKGQKKIADARAQCEQDAQNAADEHAACEKLYWAGKVADAALHPETGRIVVITCLSAENDRALILGEKDPDERTILTSFWDLYKKMRAARRKMVGVNILQFDLPFLVTRSWILDVPVPSTVRAGRYFDATFVDLREIWLMNRRWNDCESSLDHMAKTLGVGSKADGLAGQVTGATFAQMWESSDVEKRAAARAYALNDVLLPQLIAGKMGVV